MPFFEKSLSFKKYHDMFDQTSTSISSLNCFPHNLNLICRTTQLQTKMRKTSIFTWKDWFLKLEKYTFRCSFSFWLKLAFRDKRNETNDLNDTIFLFFERIKHFLISVFEFCVKIKIFFKDICFMLSFKQEIKIETRSFIVKAKTS
jgi:hypothetical protein